MSNARSRTFVPFLSPKVDMTLKSPLDQNLIVIIPNLMMILKNTSLLGDKKGDKSPTSNIRRVQPPSLGVVS